MRTSDGWYRQELRYQVSKARARMLYAKKRNKMSNKVFCMITMDINQEAQKGPPNMLLVWYVKQGGDYCATGKRLKQQDPTADLR